MAVGMDVYVIGYASHPPAERILTKRLEEMVYDTSAQALRAAGVERREIDHITIAACDELDGRSISNMLMVAPAGGYLKDELRVTDSGMVGLHLAAMRIASGRYSLGLLASWNKTSIAPFEDVMRMRCEPFFTRPIGLNAAIADALFAQAQCDRGNASEDQASATSASLQRNAASNPRGLRRKPASNGDIAGSAYIATPLRQAHCAPVSDGAVSMVLASGDWLKRQPNAKPLARIGGIGSSIDHYYLGKERLAGLSSFRQAWDRALRQANIRSAAAIGAVETDCQTAYHALAYAATLDLKDSPAFCPSGSAFAQNPYFCSGLINLIEAIEQVRGTAGPVQQSAMNFAAAHGQHGFAQQGNVVAVVERV
jgi:acetyl-CoA acetyltransferase